MSSNCPCFLLQLTFLECFMFHASMVVQFTFTSFESSLLFPLSLRSSLFLFRFRFSISSLLASHWSFAGVPFFRFVSKFVPFPNSRNSLSLFLSLAKLATGFDLAPPRKCSRAFSPKTMVSWALLKDLVLVTYTIFLIWSPLKKRHLSTIFYGLYFKFNLTLRTAAMELILTRIV